MEESRKYKYDFIQSNLDRSKPRVSQDLQKDTKLVGFNMSKKEMDDLFKALGSSKLSRIFEEAYLFMQAVQKIMVEVLEWGKSNDKQLQKLQEEIELMHKCIDRLHKDAPQVKEVDKGKEVRDLQKDGKKQGRKEGMEVQSIYAIVAGQAQIDEHVLKTSLVSQLEKENKMDELGLIVQGKWNHCIVETISKITKHRIVLFNSRTGRYKDLGDLKEEKKIMIYVKGSDCALMKKSAKKKNFGQRGFQQPYQGRGPASAYGRGWEYEGGSRGMPFFIERFPGRRLY